MFLLSDLYGYNFSENIKFASDSEMEESSSESESESDEEDSDSNDDGDDDANDNAAESVTSDAPMEHFVVPSFSYVEKNWGPCTPNVRVCDQEIDDDYVVDLNVDTNDILLEECNEETEKAGVQQQSNIEYEDGEIVSSTAEENVSHSHNTETLRTPCLPPMYNNSSSSNNNTCNNSNVVKSEDGSRMYVTATGQRFAVKRVSALTRTRSPQPKVRKLNDEKETVNAVSPKTDKREVVLPTKSRSPSVSSESSSDDEDKTRAMKSVIGFDSKTDALPMTERGNESSKTNSPTNRRSLENRDKSKTSPPVFSPSSSSPKRHSVDVRSRRIPKLSPNSRRRKVTATYRTPLRYRKSVSNAKRRLTPTANSVYMPPSYKIKDSDDKAAPKYHDLVDDIKETLSAFLDEPCLTEYAKKVNKCLASSSITASLYDNLPHVINQCGFRYHFDIGERMHNLSDVNKLLFLRYCLQLLSLGVVVRKYVYSDRQTNVGNSLPNFAEMFNMAGAEFGCMVKRIYNFGLQKRSVVMPSPKRRHSAKQSTTPKSSKHAYDESTHHRHRSASGTRANDDRSDSSYRRGFDSRRSEAYTASTGYGRGSSSSNYNNNKTPEKDYYRRRTYHSRTTSDTYKHVQHSTSFEETDRVYNSSNRHSPYDYSKRATSSGHARYRDERGRNGHNRREKEDSSRYSYHRKDSKRPQSPTQHSHHNNTYFTDRIDQSSQKTETIATEQTDENYDAPSASVNTATTTMGPHYGGWTFVPNVQLPTYNDNTSTATTAYSTATVDPSSMCNNIYGTYSTISNTTDDSNAVQYSNHQPYDTSNYYYG